MTLVIPDGLTEASALTHRIDEVFGSGWSRLTPSDTAALAELAASFSGTPLESALSEASLALAGGELLAHHLAAVAAGRASIEGARADALLAVATEALGLKLESPETTPAPSASPEDATRMDAIRQWLVELALAGFQQLEAAAIAPIFATLEPVQSRVELQRLASLVTGFASELMDHTPTTALDEPPLRRWTDLWCRSMLATYALPAEVNATPVSGTLHVLGADIRHHDHLLSVVVHGLLHTDGQNHLVRTTLSAWKVDAVAGPEIWKLVMPLAPELVGALAKPALLHVEGMTRIGGDLLWDGSAKVGAAYDPFAVDLKEAILHAPAAHDRHSLLIAVPCVTAPKSDEFAAEVSMERVSPHAGLDAAKLKKQVGLVGLLRFDETWSVQPLAARVGKKLLGPAEGIAASAKVKTAALDILRERASKLLRS